VALSLETEYSLFREAGLHFDLLIDNLWLCGACIVFKDVASERLVFQRAVVEFGQGALEDENDVLGADCWLVSSTAGRVVEERSILHLLREAILVLPRICGRELSLENLLGLPFHEESTSVFLSIGSNDTFFQSVLAVLIVDCLELRVAEDLESLAHLIELKLVDLHVGGVAHGIAPHGKSPELPHNGLVCGIARDLQNFVVVGSSFKNAHFNL